MRLLHSIRGKCLRLLRALGYRAAARHFGVLFPLRLAPSSAIIGQLDAQRYERAETLLVRKHIPPGVVVLELGGSLGIVSSVILHRRPSRLVSYEAVPELAAIAREVVALNHPSADYLCVNKAVGPSGVSETTFFWSPELSLAGSSEVSGAKGLVSLVVPSVDLSHVLAEHRIGEGAWLVADIEGMEYELLQNQTSALRSFAGVIIECHTSEQGGRFWTRQDAENMLADQGFRMIQRIGPVICMVR